MLNARFGQSLTQDLTSWIIHLMNGNEISISTGIPENITLDLLKNPTDKYLNIVTGSSIGEACLKLQIMDGKVLDKAAVLIKFNYNHQLQITDFTPLIEYFDAFPGDSQITWGYSIDTAQEVPVSIIILKIYIQTQ